MKLYTEEQVKRAINAGMHVGYSINFNVENTKTECDDVFKHIDFFELPTDEEVTHKGLFDYASKHGEHCDPAGYSDKQVDRWHGFYDGATWLINKIKGGENAD